MTKDKNAIILKKNIKIFKILASAFANEEITILQSHDETGSYYEKNIILPKKICLIQKKQLNKYCYIYKILFSIISKKLNLYIRNNKENIDYKILFSLITIKTINKKLTQHYKNIKKILKKIYPIVNKTRRNITKLNERCLLIEIIIKKLTYEKIKENLILNKEEKIWLFEIENTLNIEEKNITEKTTYLYNKLTKIHKNYQEPTFYLLWGYIYTKKDIKINKIIKQIKQNKIKKQKSSNKSLIINKINNIKKQNNIQAIFDYKKTHDKYNNNNKNTDKSTSISENKNKNSSTTNADHSISLLVKSNIIKTITTQNNYSNNKKLTYKEWDHTQNTYKNNWCHLFIKNLHSKNKETFKINENIKTEIKLFKKYFKLILNKSSINKKKITGYDIDIDSIVDNYQEVYCNIYNKVYIQKNKKSKDTAVLILIDSSLSTESFYNETQTLEKLKTIAYIIAEGINNTTSKFIISTFHSNTRYDCRYLIIKDINEQWIKKKYTLLNIKPNGYTRIGPALRHSITLLKKIKTEKKIIILLSDGTPTDYDEYEGLYGLSDIKKVITEANKQKIYIKTLLINNKNNDLFIKTMKKQNCYKIDDKSKIYTKIIKIFNSI
ncbi:hypothetical protein [Candidatus Azoamicus ciliaticola]|uniref:VWFA domain-containing protein n=1 Tax=Candidatus Azoamicus ciliaticola TaxID=2652803 RepID=A0A6J5JWV1_9GAMM|nr:hypothetical protein [Candidatus Azoamicus ciliaticola]CAB3976415.1 Uncharacterised protein [Candidatus Azoamicus ciliaticola]